MAKFLFGLLLRQAERQMKTPGKDQLFVGFANRCGLGVVGRPHRAGETERRAGRPGLSLLRDHGGGHRFRPRRCASGATRPFPATTPIWTTACRRVLPGCLQARHQDHQQPGLDQSRRRGASASCTGCASMGAKGVKVAAVSGSLITDRVARARRHDSGKRRADLDAGRHASSRRKPISAPSRSSRRCAGRRRSSSPAASPIRRCSWRR